MKRKLKWAAINLSEITLIVLAIFYNQVWAGRLIFFWFVYSLLAILFIVIIRLLAALVIGAVRVSTDNDETNKDYIKIKELQTKFSKALQTRIVPRWLNFSSDAIQIGLLIGAGFWITGILKSTNSLIWFFATLSTQEVLEAEKGKNLTKWLTK